MPFRLCKQAFDVSLFGHSRLCGDRLSTLCRDFADDFVSIHLAGRVVHNDRRAFRGEMFGDGRTDAFGRAGDDGDFARKFFCAHDLKGLSFSSCISFFILFFILSQIVGMFPPSMTYSLPMIEEARSEARNATNSATSSGRLGRPSGIPPSEFIKL